MASNRAVLEAYGGDRAVEFTTASGVKVVGRCLTISQAVQCMRLDELMREQAARGSEAELQRATAADLKATLAAEDLYRTTAAEMARVFMELVDFFQNATGIGDARVTPAEIVQEVLPHFLAESGTPNPLSPTQTSPTMASKSC